MQKRLIVVGGVVLIVLAVLVAVLAWPRGSDPVDEKDVIESFRESSTSATSEVAPEEAGTPAPGVYRFTGSGGETVKLGPIPAETREFPTEVTAAISETTDGCFTLTLNLIEQHIDETTFCRSDDGGLSLEQYQKKQVVSVFDATVDIACDPNRILEPSGGENAIGCTLTLLGGPAEVTIDLPGTATTSDAEPVTLDGEEREVVAVDLHFDLEGSVAGTWDENLRFTTDDALLVGIEREFHLAGVASFDESFAYELTSAVPAS